MKVVVEGAVVERTATSVATTLSRDRFSVESELLYACCRSYSDVAHPYSTQKWHRLCTEFLQNVNTHQRPFLYDRTRFTGIGQERHGDVVRVPTRKTRCGVHLRARSQFYS